MPRPRRRRRDPANQLATGTRTLLPQLHWGEWGQGV